MRKTLLCLAFLVLPCVSGCDGGSDTFDSSSYTYVAIGASDATGIGADPPTDGYVFLIEDSLDERGDVELVNLGIPGAKVEDMRELELPVAEEVEPELVTIFAGGNDVTQGTDPASFEEDLREILSSLSDGARIIALADLPDLTRLPKFQEDPDPDVTPDRVAAFNSIIRRLAGQFPGVRLVPLSNIPINSLLVDDDGFHPSDEGHRRIADEFLAVIGTEVP